MAQFDSLCSDSSGLTGELESSHSDCDVYKAVSGLHDLVFFLCVCVCVCVLVRVSECLAYSCFTQLMKRMSQNFPNGGAMDTHFANMRSLIQVMYHFCMS